jgi:hypothetical protein
MRPCNVQPLYDGITRHGLDLYEERVYLYNRDSGICQTCSERVSFDAFEVAHSIANTIANRKRWGAAVIDSPLNKAITHRGRCNSARNIGGNPGACRELIARISATFSTRSEK